MVRDTIAGYKIKHVQLLEAFVSIPLKQKQVVLQPRSRNALALTALVAISHI